jgi:hypothetical protein
MQLVYLPDRCLSAIGFGLGSGPSFLPRLVPEFRASVDIYKLHRRGQTGASNLFFGNGTFGESRPSRSRRAGGCRLQKLARSHGGDAKQRFRTPCREVALKKMENPGLGPVSSCARPFHASRLCDGPSFAISLESRACLLVAEHLVTDGGGKQCHLTQPILRRLVPVSNSRDDISGYDEAIYGYLLNGWSRRRPGPSTGPSMPHSNGNKQS